MGGHCAGGVEIDTVHASPEENGKPRMDHHFQSNRIICFKRALEDKLFILLQFLRHADLGETTDDFRWTKNKSEDGKGHIPRSDASLLDDPSPNLHLLKVCIQHHPAMKMLVDKVHHITPKIKIKLHLGGDFP